MLDVDFCAGTDGIKTGQLGIDSLILDLGKEKLGILELVTLRENSLRTENIPVQADTAVIA